MAKSKKKSKKSGKSSEPCFILKEKESLLRRHGKLILFNQKELDAINEYCVRFKVSSQSALIRQAVMERVLEGLEESHPTLF